MPAEARTGHGGAARGHRDAHHADGQQDPALSNPAAEGLGRRPAGTRVAAQDHPEYLRTAMSEAVRIGSRGSALALWQANEVARQLRERGFAPEIVTVRTSGDKQQDIKTSSIGGKGVFIKELEEALDAGRIDMAVHSLKDVPSIVPERFTLAAFLERADPRDVWIHPERK